MATFGGSNIVTDGLVLWLDAANRKSYPGSGNTWLDLSGNNNTGTLTNGPTFSSANNGSIVFDGTNDYVNCGTNTNLSPIDGITVGCWVYFNNINRREIFIGKGNGQIANTNQYWIEKLNTNVFQLLIVTDIPSAVESRLGLSDFIIQNNTWYFVCLTYNRQNLRGFVNGVQSINTLAITSPLHFTEYNLGVGRLGDLPSLPMEGKIAAAQIYNRALSAQEVRQNYDALKSRYLNIY
jgi:hypothetical protein